MADVQHPYVRAWETNLGAHAYYLEGQTDIAAADDAPSDAIYYQDFNRITQHERESALQAERDGEAVVLRRDGEPYRVWHRVNAIRGQEKRERITAMAERLRAGKPAHGQ